MGGAMPLGTCGADESGSGLTDIERVIRGVVDELISKVQGLALYM